MSAIQPETRLLIKQLIRRNDLQLFDRCDSWVEKQSAGKYRSMLALIEVDGDTETRQQLTQELTRLLAEGNDLQT